MLILQFFQPCHIWKRKYRILGSNQYLNSESAYSYNHRSFHTSAFIIFLYHQPFFEAFSTSPQQIFCRRPRFVYRSITVINRFQPGQFDLRTGRCINPISWLFNWRFFRTLRSDLFALPWNILRGRLFSYRLFKTLDYRCGGRGFMDQIKLRCRKRRATWLFDVNAQFCRRINGADRNQIDGASLLMGNEISPPLRWKKAEWTWSSYTGSPHSDRKPTRQKLID